MPQSNERTTVTQRRKLQFMGLALAVLAVAYARTALSYGVDVTGRTVEPGALPFLLGGLLLLLSVLLMVTADRKSAPDEQGSKDRRRAFTRSAQFFLALVGYVALVTLIGFLIATLVGAAAILRLLFKYSYRLATLYAVGVTLLCYAVFVLALGVRLP